MPIAWMPRRNQNEPPGPPPPEGATDLFIQFYETNNFNEALECHVKLVEMLNLPYGGNLPGFYPKFKRAMKGKELFT